MRAVALEDALFLGAVSLERGEGWVRPWRIPHAELPLFPPDGIGGKAEIPAGVRLACVTTTSSVWVDIAPAAQPTALDCVVDGRLAASRVVPAGESRAVFDGLGGGRKRVEIYLSQAVPVRVAGLSVEDGAAAEPVPAGRPRWITYGSSISQCVGAASPAETWPALVARRHDLDLTCLGFGGNCHLEPMVARLIRDRAADLVSLCLGINVYGAASLGPRTFRTAVIGFARLVREGHPGAPIAVISPIFSPPREAAANGVGLSLGDMRRQIEEAVGALRACGDAHVHYVDGRSLLGPDDAGRLPDQLHPDADGYRLMARNFSRAVAAPIFGLAAADGA